MPRERVLSVRELNRALLARQLLLRRARLSVPRAIERVGALQAQWPPSPYVALWSRLEAFTLDRLARALERRHVVKATLMRTTLHHVTARDYLAYAGLLNADRVRWVERQLARYPGETTYSELLKDLELRASERPRSRPELLELLGQPSLVVDERRPWLVWHLLAVKAGLVLAPPASMWRMNTAGGKFVTANTWLGAEGAGGVEAAMYLVRRYLAAFGPASRADAAQWTGLPVNVLQPALERLPLRRFRDERGHELVDLLRAPLPAANVEAPPRFLPMWDSTLLAHEDRTRILPEDYRSSIIRRNGDVQQTFLVDGFVAGTWKVVGDRVELEPMRPLTRAERRELELEGRALARFYASASRSGGLRDASPPSTMPKTA